MVWGSVLKGLNFCVFTFLTHGIINIMFSDEINLKVSPLYLLI